MKIRISFITNSSSSSFVIFKRHLTEEQKNAIYDHIGYARDNLGWRCSVVNEDGELSYDWEWNIEEDESAVYGDTWLDNFDMYDFLGAIGVNMDHVYWDGTNNEAYPKQ